MELKIQPYKQPNAIVFNFEELKTAIETKASEYASLVYTDEQIKTAKNDRANLNKLKKALNDERLKQEREYMKPFDVFKAQVKELVTIIDKPCNLIDTQIKEYEERIREGKREEIEEYFNSKEKHSEFSELMLERIFDERWLNASVSMQTVTKAIDDTFTQIAQDIDTIVKMGRHTAEALRAYKRRLNLADAMGEIVEIDAEIAARQAREAERAKQEELRRAQEAQEQPIVAEAETVAESEREQPAAFWLSFQAFVTPTQAMGLKAYLQNNDIKFRAI